MKSLKKLSNLLKEYYIPQDILEGIEKIYNDLELKKPLKAEDIIKEIKKLPNDELKKVQEFIISIYKVPDLPLAQEMLDEMGAFEKNGS